MNAKRTVMIRKVKKFKKDGKPGFLRIYFMDNQEVAKEILDSEFELIEQKGYIPDGMVEEYNTRNKLYFRASYKNGKRHGKSLIFYDTGNIKVEKEY
ncbi:MAG: hypothetical protein HOF07_00910, partial [Elusimicrobiaceae bacterium]|nr:hypothetical protein [Elusimicrobiaceae bacterium]